MEVSKLQISPEVLSEHLTKERKTELRRGRVIDLIKSKPEGAQITLSEFAAVTGMRPNNAHYFLKQMAKAGLISIEKLSPHELTYHVLTNEPHAALQPTQPQNYGGVVPHDQKVVVDLAMSYFWETHDDSLHGFVEWVQKQ
jgi:hypothetical protein